MTPDAPPDVELHAWIGADVTVGAPTTGGRGPELNRVQAVVSEGRFGGTFQLATRTEDVHEQVGTAALLDAVVAVAVREGVSVRAGRFKTRMSQGHAVPLPEMRLPRRALLVDATPGRELGVEASVAAGPARLHLALFQPGDEGTWLAPGARPMLAADVALAPGLVVHGAVATWARATSSRDAAKAQRWDHQGDLGLRWSGGGATLALEGLVGRVVDSGAWEGGLTALAAQRFPTGRADVEVAFGWDSARLHGADTHRLTSALNLHVDALRAVAWLSLTSQVDAPDGRIAPEARARFLFSF